MLAPISRILLRYGTGAMVGMGFMSQDLQGQLLADADVIQIVSYTLGLVSVIVVEGYYWLAKQRNWTT